MSRTNPSNVTMTFTDNLRPSVEAGRYTISVTQKIKNFDTTVDGDEYLTPVHHDFIIRAPQFHLDNSFLHAVHPPPGMNGAFHTSLPHIALSRALLPWERPINPSQSTSDGTPWLALIVLTPADKVVPHTWTVEQALSAQGTIPAVQLPALDQADLTPQERAGACTTVDLPPDLFATLLPTRAELHLLAHARTGGSDTIGDETTAVGNGNGTYSVVIANRFPSRNGGTYTAHLVSLEGHHAVLGTTPDNPVRMFSLTSWSFTSHPDEAGGFGPLAQHLGRPTKDLDGRAGILRRPLPTAEVDATTQRLRDGYLPFAHHTLAGPRTFAWYRGPLTPVPAVGVPLPAVCTDPSQALIYVEDSGVFDVSYANAFSLGRALALAAPDFTTQLATFRRTFAQRLAHQAQRSTHPDHATDGTTDALTRLDDLLRSGLQEKLEDLFTTTSPTPHAEAAALPHPAPAPDPHQALIGQAQDPKTALGQCLAHIIAWLRDLALLTPVPFVHLVPDPAALPDESLRFFHIDATWQRVLRDGALSIGRSRSQDEPADTALTTLLASADLPVPVAGMLIHSVLADGWPALAIDARGQDGRPLTILRRARLDQDVLLVLFDGVPQDVDITEPHQGLHFGITDTREIALRDIDEGNAGVPLEKKVSLHQGFFRQAGPGVEILKVADLAQAMTASMGRTKPLTASQFALQFITSPEKITFRRS
ncbi:hypothetical protein [Streptomyces noursei]|uniref:hypothetical protein n=1 Tax=Streptomyces noursei TaxID=1971 RepID=UPI0016788AC6|nr:hypothetical protein [Streptomyces noursei]MCZ1021266.1 hypothetical protein [Streptomyces noursei]GGX54842.1 hypothetical protein GCM10010341_89840 [Streptomyces noursei]